MAEKILPYDRAIVPQETGYWCGPAATQVVLNSRGIVVSEQELARQIGTTVNGTDFVGLIERVLDNITPDARYASVYLEQDPPTVAQREALWRNLKASIDAGFGVVVNWVAPPSNYPRGVKGSTSPAYRGGTVFHYVAAMGYDDTPGARAVWIADSGFAPFGYWISFDQCASLIPPKGYAYAAAGVAGTDGDAVSILAQVMSPTVVDLDRLGDLLPDVQRCFAASDINTVPRIAMWCAQIGTESGGLRWQEEIASGAEYEGRIDLGNTQPGDGVRFKGRDFIQVTGRHNYTLLSQWAFGKGLVPSPTFFVDSPQALATDEYAFLGAGWYWTTQRPMNDLIDAGESARWGDYRGFEAVTAAINGGINGLDDRRARYQRALAMGDQLLKLTGGEDTFMSALSAAEQREMLDLLRWLAAPDTGELRKRFPSRSPLRHLGEGLIDTAAGVNLNDDANDHVVLVKELAEIGDPGALALLREVAGADPVKYPDRQADRVLAQRILDHLPAPAVKVDAQPAAGGGCALGGGPCALVASQVK